MRRRSYKEIKSVDLDLVEAVVEQSGRPPDNFVESAEATFVGLPDLETDPDALKIMGRLTTKLNEYGANIPTPVHAETGGYPTDSNTLN